MTTLRTAAQQALEALEGKRFTSCGWRTECDKAITALRAALAEPVQEPVAWYHVPYPNNGAAPIVSFRKQHEPSMYGAVVPLYLAPPQRKPLETKQLEQIMADCFADKSMPPNWWHWSLRSFARAIERAHGIGDDT